MNIFSKSFLAVLFTSTALVSLSAQNKTAETEIKTESSAPSEDMYIDDIVQKRLVVENRLLSYEPVREADIAWEKKMWRIIDAREKMNLVWKAEEQPFFNIIKDLVQNGDITVFEDEKFKEPLSFKQVEGKLFKIDTITTFDYDTYEEKIEVVKNTKDWHNINQFRIKEIWFFDKEASMLKNRIIAIAPLYEEAVGGTADGVEVSQKLTYPLFWIYYPEARNFLSKYRVISDANDMAPMTWTDLLDNRYFSSYIYKRSNVLDYGVKDFFDEKDDRYSMDILLESEKIKNELFNFEHDLWEY